MLSPSVLTKLPLGSNGILSSEQARRRRVHDLPAGYGFLCEHVVELGGKPAPQSGAAILPRGILAQPFSRAVVITELCDPGNHACRKRLEAHIVKLKIVIHRGKPAWAFPILELDGPLSAAAAGDVRHWQ